MLFDAFSNTETNVEHISESFLLQWQVLVTQQLTCLSASLVGNSSVKSLNIRKTLLYAHIFYFKEGE